jgi:hypothetical protein
MMKTVNTFAVAIFSVLSITASMFGRHFDTLKVCQAFVLNVSKNSGRRTHRPIPSIDVAGMPLAKQSDSFGSIQHVSQYCYTTTRIYSTSSSSSGAASTSRKTLDSPWNVTGLKKEVGRLIQRSHKKIGKASERLRKTQEGNGTALPTTAAAFKDQLDVLYRPPDTENLHEELETLRARLQSLNKLESALEAYDRRSNSTTLPADIAELALSLGVDDTPPAKQDRGPSKPKGPRVSPPRLPYRRFYSQEKTEIRVGKTAADNDEISTSAEHRSDLWMHASGCPGSHIIIRTGGNVPDEETIQDAAALAARHSKCHGSVIKVSLTQCRNVKKPPFAKPGLVMLSGSVRTIAVTMKAAEKRLERLDKTELING